MERTQESFCGIFKANSRRPALNGGELFVPRGRCQSTDAPNPYHRVTEPDVRRDGHKFGVTHLSFYPFDCLAFLSSSYDHFLKIYSTESMTASASFDLASVVYSHTISPVASHLLVACATQHSTVRLVDLRSRASVHSLAGHAGAVLSLAWSPKHEHILASAGTDGTVRLWDVRRSAPALGVLDLEDSVGIAGYDGLGRGARPREKGRAHAGAANGVVWTDDARHLVTTGHDARVRVWDAATGANTLAAFGPTIKNSNLSTLLPLIAPIDLVRKPLLFFPSEKEILVFDLLEGTLLRRLKVPGAAIDSSSSHRNVQNRVTALAWRHGEVEVLSAHSDGVIRSWSPRTGHDVRLDEEEADREASTVDARDEERKRRRDVLDEVYRDLTRQKITF